MEINEQDEEKRLKRRYSESIPPMKVTFNRLLKTVEYMNLVKALKKEGWLDWHILVATMHIVLNFKASLIPSDLQNFNQIFEHYIAKEETENEKQVPLHFFTKENMYSNLYLSMLATLKGYGYSLNNKHFSIKDFKVISKMLEEKYRYWSRDIPHDDIFKFI